MHLMPCISAGPPGTHHHLLTHLSCAPMCSLHAPTCSPPTPTYNAPVCPCTHVPMCSLHAPMCCTPPEFLIYFFYTYTPNSIYPTQHCIRINTSSHRTDTISGLLCIHFPRSIQTSIRQIENYIPKIKPPQPVWVELI